MVPFNFKTCKLPLSEQLKGFSSECQQVSCELTSLLAGVVALCAVERLFT